MGQSDLNRAVDDSLAAFHERWAAGEQYSRDLAEQTARAADPAKFLRQMGDWNDAVAAAEIKKGQRQ